MSIFYIITGLMFMIASAGAVDGTAAPMWVAIHGIVGSIFMFIGIKLQGDE
tara:strand:+ start:165 stop:317 length:153 start_codon:yes stop_codon:yes gene_type:complete